MLFEGGAVVPADVFLDALSAPKAVLASLSLKELVERRVALALKARIDSAACTHPRRGTEWFMANPTSSALTLNG